MFVIARCVGNSRDVFGEMVSAFLFKCSENTTAQQVFFAGKYEIDKGYILRLEEMHEEDKKTNQI